MTLWAYLDPNTQKGFLYAVDPESGKATWVTSVAGLLITPPATAKGLAFFAVEEPGPTPTSSSDRETLYAVNAADGQVKWKFSTGKKFEATRLLIVGNSICFCTEINLLELGLDSGRQLWSFKANEVGEIQADDQRLYVATHQGSIMRPKDTLHFAAVALFSGAIGLVTAITNTTRFVNADWADFLSMVSIGFGFPVIFVSGAVGLVLAVVHQEERPLLVMAAVSLLMLPALGLVLADKLGGFAFAAWLVSTDAILIFYCVRWFRFTRKRTIGPPPADKQGPGARASHPSVGRF